VVVDGVNGRLLTAADEAAFATTVEEMLRLPSERREYFRREAWAAAESLAMPVCAARVLELYAGLLGRGHRGATHDPSLWAAALRRLDEEWMLVTGKGAALFRLS